MQSPLTENYQIARFGPEYHDAFRQLYRNAFGRVLPSDYFSRHFNTHSLGGDVIGFIAIHNKTGIAAAFHGAFPVAILQNGKRLNAAQSGDSMTHSEHRKKGLFKFLAKLTANECRKSGISLNFRQPNAGSYPGVTASGWQHRDDIVRWIMKPERFTFPLPKILKLTGGFNRIYLTYAKSRLKKIAVDEPQTFHCPAGVRNMIVCRDRDYLKYKRSQDKFFIKIDGVIFWIKLTDMIWVGDMSDYSAVTPAVIKKLKQLALNLGYNTICFDINRSIRPSFLENFSEYSSQASCILYLDPALVSHNITLTGADSDTW